jgi:hypothetical protein
MLAGQFSIFGAIEEKGSAGIGSSTGLKQCLKDMA